MEYGFEKLHQTHLSSSFLIRYFEVQYSCGIQSFITRS